jgi:hypothetical protein
LKNSDFKRALKIRCCAGSLARLDSGGYWKYAISGRRASREHGGSFRVAVDYHERSDGERDMNRLEKLKNNENERLVAGRIGPLEIR